MTRPARVVIDIPSQHHNLSRVRQLAPGSRIMAIVKAHAYGHGRVRVARANEPDHPNTPHQLEVFRATRRELSGEWSLANSAGTIPCELTCGVHKRLRVVEDG